MTVARVALVGCPKASTAFRKGVMKAVLLPGAHSWPTARGSEAVVVLAKFVVVEAKSTWGK